MRVVQTNRFKKAYKKLHSNQLTVVNEAITDIIEDPSIGEQKKGDLSWLRVYKFKLHDQLVLLGYSIESDQEITLTLIDFGVHENFYRDLKQ